jgi:hypothetical protein
MLLYKMEEVEDAVKIKDIRNLLIDLNKHVNY